MAQYKDDGFELVNDDHTDDPTYDSHRKHSYGSYDNDDRYARDDRYDRDDDQKYSSRRNSGYDDDEDDKRPVNALQKALSIDPKAVDSAAKAARRIQAIVFVVVFFSIFGFVIYDSVLRSSFSFSSSPSDEEVIREAMEKAMQEAQEQFDQKMREAEMAERIKKAEQAKIAEQAEKTEKEHFYSELLKMAKILQDKPAFDKSYYEYLISRLLDLSLTPENLKEINEIAAAFGEKIHDTIDVAPSDDIVDYKTASEQFGKLYIQLTKIEPSEFEKYESQLLKLMSSPDDYYAYKGMKTTFEKQLKSSKKANKKSKRKSKELYFRGT